MNKNIWDRVQNSDTNGQKYVKMLLSGFLMHACLPPVASEIVCILIRVLHNLLYYNEQVKMLSREEVLVFG